MNEVELKSIVDDPEAAKQRLREAGAELLFRGRLEDRRYDTPDRALRERDHMLRLRIYRDESGALATLDWKGATRLEGGYKVREERSVRATDADALATILERLGYEVAVEIDRDVDLYQLGGATVRFERYPRLDVLVEVEGEPEEIEAAIRVLGLPREGFTTERLLEFVTRFEARTGQRAALSDRALAGDVTRPRRYG